MKIEYKGDEIIISDFKPVEAYKIARRLEAEGINFYNLFLSATHDDGVRKAMQSLLAEEAVHLKTFQAKVKELSGSFEDTGIVDEIDTEVFGSFGEPVDLSSIVNDKEKAIGLGILFEKRSISFFKSCLDKTTDPATRRAFSEIIKEEEGHAVILKGLLRTLKGR